MIIIHNINSNILGILLFKQPTRVKIISFRHFYVGARLFLYLSDSLASFSNDRASRDRRDKNLEVHIFA